MKQKLTDTFDSLADVRNYLEQLRTQGDIYPINAMTYVVTDYELMRTIFRQPDDFRTFDFGDRIRQLQKIDPIAYDFEDIRVSMSDWLLFIEGPDHMYWKKRLMQRMYVLDLQGIIEAEWEQVACVLDQRDEFDLMVDVCEPLICRIISSIIGIDPKLFRKIRQIEKQFMKAFVPAMSLDSLREVKDAHNTFRSMQFAGWEEGTLNQARLLHILLNEVKEDERSSVMSQIEFLLPGGIESSIMLLSESIFRLITDLRHNAEMLKNAEGRSLLVEELIRMCSSITVVTRRAVRDMEIGGVPIKEGSALLLFIACANRDPRYFPFPMEVNAGNLKTPHLAFGLGRHYCIGTELSRMEMNFILPAFMDRFGSTSQVMPETMKRSFYTPGIESVSVNRNGANIHQSLEQVTR
jgi:cytochrome P450